MFIKSIFCILYLTISYISNNCNGFFVYSRENVCLSESNIDSIIYCSSHCCNNSLKHPNDNKKHKLAIVVPFRDRFDELLHFVPSISKYLIKKSIDFEIYIINQADNYRFNRAALINIGFLFSMKECDYMAMHDVDLIPLNKDLDYSYPIDGPYHVAAPSLHPKYNYEKFIGGILIVNKKHYLKVNGMSNKFFGWGREDDEFYMRLQDANLNVSRPDITNFKTDSTNTFRHNHCPIKRKRDSFKYPKQKNDAFRRDHDTGLDTIQYRLVNHELLKIGNYSCIIVNVQLFCKKLDTPWCEHDFQFVTS